LLASCIATLRSTNHYCVCGTSSEVAAAVEADYGKVDILVHSLANGPEVTKPLLETSRKGYLAASSASAYSAVSLIQKFGPIMNEVSSSSTTYCCNFY
jgi:enoyl-[acyl-carrier protein] reductase I